MALSFRIKSHYYFRFDVDYTTKPKSGLKGFKTSWRQLITYFIGDFEEGILLSLTTQYS